MINFSSLQLFNFDRALASLEAALLTDAELAEGEAGWRKLDDVLFGGQFFDMIPMPDHGGHEHKHGVNAGEAFLKFF